MSGPLLSKINEETDAVVELERAQYFEYPYRISSEKIVRTLDTGELMGDPFDFLSKTTVFSPFVYASGQSNLRLCRLPRQ